MLDNLETLETGAVRGRAEELKRGGYRFVTETSCTNEDGTVDLFYSFDRDYELVTLKTTVPAGAHVRSISDVYLAAAFVENEIGELFGVVFDDIAIDYGGHFILGKNSPETPFGAGVILERRQAGAAPQQVPPVAGVTIEKKGGGADAGK